VPGHHRERAQLLDGVQRLEPGAAPVAAGVGQEQVDVVVGGVARHHQPDHRNVQAGGGVGVGMAELDRHQPVAFQAKPVGRDRIRDRGRGRRGGQRLGEAGLPLPIQHLSLRVRAHLLDHAGNGEGPRGGERRQDGAKPEPVIGVAMGDVNGGQVPPGRRDPRAQRLGLRLGEQRVHQHRVLVAADEGRRRRRPHALVLVRRQVGDRGGDPRRDVHGVFQWRGRHAVLR